MKHYSCFLIIGLLIFTQSAWGQCASVRQSPRTEVIIETGRAIVDNSKPRSAFPSQTSATTMGLTIANITHQIQIEPDTRKIANNQTCIVLNKVKLTVSIPELNVYIDKKYKPGSCQYSVISQHEQKHVRIHQNGLKASKDKLQKALDEAVKEQKPIPLSRYEHPQQKINKQLQNITRKVEIAIKEVQDEINKRNQALDTPESYRHESRKCPKW